MPRLSGEQSLWELNNLRLTQDITALILWFRSDISPWEVTTSGNTFRQNNLDMQLFSSCGMTFLGPMCPKYCVPYPKETMIKSCVVWEDSDGAGAGGGAQTVVF